MPGYLTVVCLPKCCPSLLDRGQQREARHAGWNGPAADKESWTPTWTWRDTESLEGQRNETEREARIDRQTGRTEGEHGGGGAKA